MAELVGQTIGNYQVEALLGNGAMGQVYRGVHIHLGRAAAIKVMHVHLAYDPSFQARFLQEARSAAAVIHPNIVQTWDFGIHEGQPFLVMELVEDTLRGLLDRHAGNGPLETRLAIELLRQAAEGLGHAHEIGMVHRDVKPENLLLAAAAEAAIPVVKVADFGLARLADSETLTMTGVMVGTPAYMSPEQCQGEVVDARADVYALGVVLYEVATGARPFEVKTPTEAIYKHVYVLPPPPSTVRADLPPGLEAIVLRCLAKARNERYPSAAELAADLRSLLDGSVLDLPVPARPPAPVVSEVRGVRLAVVSEADEITIGPRLGATVTFAITNSGAIDDSYRISARGLPEDWLRLPVGDVTIAAGDERLVEIGLAVPPGQRIDVAAQRLVTLTVRSSQATNLSASAVIRCLVLAGPRGIVELQPESAGGSRRARFQATVRNAGGLAGAFAIRADSESDGLRFEAAPPELALASGQVATVGLTVAVPPRWVGRGQAHTFQVRAATADSDGLPASGTFVQRAVLPIWAGLLTALLLIAGVTGLAVWLAGDDPPITPAIASVVMIPANPLPGEPVTIRWEVSGATSVDLRPLAEGLDPDAGEWVAETGVPDGTTLTLVAHNGDESTARSLVVQSLAEDAVPEVGAIIWETDLADWQPFTTERGSSGFSDGAYRIRVTSLAPGGQPGVIQVLTDEAGYDTFSVSVELRVVESPGRSIGCLAARVDPADGTTGYNLCVAGQGADTIAWYGSLRDGVPQTEELLGYEERAGTRPAGDWNTLHIIASGDRLWFLINDRLLGAVTHDGRTTGAFGVMALSYDETPAEYVFTNLVYRELVGR